MKGREAPKGHKFTW